MSEPMNDLPGPHLSPAERDLLLEKAKAAVVNAYAPYSKYQVGAALLTEAGNLYTGCNVENSSYGLTNCAERTAIFSAVNAEGSGMHLRAMAVWSNPEGPCSPCGACRQVIFEFGPKAIVLFQGMNGIEEFRASDLLPHGFLFEPSC
jgi:cytidine deaminase